MADDDIADRMAGELFSRRLEVTCCCARLKCVKDEGLITQASETGAGIIIRGGIAHGGPEAEIQRPQLNDVWTEAGLDEVLPSGMKRAELILRYTLSHPKCHTTIVGTCNSDHLAENVAAAAEGPLPAGLYEEVSARVDRILN